MKGREVFVFANGNVKKLPRCNVQLCEAEVDENEEEEREVSKENKKNSVSFEEKTDEVETEGEKMMVTRSMTELGKNLERKEF